MRKPPNESQDRMTKLAAGEPPCRAGYGNPLYDLAVRSYSDVAQIMGLSVQTVRRAERTALYKIRNNHAKLKEKL